MKTHQYPSYARLFEEANDAKTPRLLVVSNADSPAVVPPKNPSSLNIVFVHVVFVNESGEPLSQDSEQVIRKANLPASARMPSGDVAHDILFGKSEALFVIQLKSKKPSVSDIRKVGGRITRALQDEKYKLAVVHCERLFNGCGGKAEGLKALIHGLQTPTYALADFKSKKKERALRAVDLAGHGIPDKKFEEARALAEDIVIAEHMSRRWIDLPAQEGAMSTDDLVRLATQVANSYREGSRLVVDIEVLQGGNLAEKGLNLLWNVGKGRTDGSPALVVLRYQGAGKSAPTTALVGKGIVFDTGGENLKTGDGIDGMHADMGGAAMALATFDLVVRRKAKVNLIAALAIADNSVSGSSYHPRSILKSYCGKTVEVLNTDAEGRLVLADAVCYIEKNYKPDYLVTLATLTGACVSALGNEFAGLFAKTEKIAYAIEEASRRSWNKVWCLPLSEAEHTNLRPSSVADVTNLGGRAGGAITAAKFILEEFATTKHAAHLDVAGVAASIGSKAVDATGKECSFSTGWGPALLWEMIHLLSKGK